MAAISAPLSLRDFIQNIFPAIIAICLFVPFFSTLNKISVEALIMTGAILGYVTSPIIEWLSGVTDHFPWMHNKYEKYKESMKWHMGNWDYNQLFNTMDSEDREYLNLTASYIRFCKTTGFYFFIYIVVNLYWLWHQSSLQPQPTRFWEIKTPMLGEWEFPTFWLVCISFILMYGLLMKALSEYQQLFLEKGQYVIMAGKYHQKDGSIAKCIWGKLVRKEEKSEQSGFSFKNFLKKVFGSETENKKPCLNLYKVQLKKNDSIHISETTVDDEGFFRFCDEYKTVEKIPEESAGQVFVLIEKFDNISVLSKVAKDKVSELLGENQGTIYTLVATHKTQPVVIKKISIQEKKVPYFEITVT